jgi:hypothetical protein
MVRSQTRRGCVRAFATVAGGMRARGEDDHHMVDQTKRFTRFRLNTDSSVVTRRASSTARRRLRTLRARGSAAFNDFTSSNASIARTRSRAPASSTMVRSLSGNTHHQVRTTPSSSLRCTCRPCPTRQGCTPALRHWPRQPRRLTGNRRPKLRRIVRPLALFSSLLVLSLPGAASVNCGIGSALGV